MALRVDVPLPAAARPVQAELCGVQWVLERRGDGVRCVAMDGEVVWEGVLGLPETGCRLRVEAFAPRYPVELEVAGGVVLAPGGRVRGWFSIPLGLRLVSWCGGGRALELVVVEEPGLRVGWREGEGYHHPHRDELHRGPRADWSRPSRRFWIRALCRNDGSEVAWPRRCRLVLDGWELWSLRGFAVGPRLEWTFGEGGGVRLLPLPGLAPRSSAILAPNFRRFGGTAS